MESDGFDPYRKWLAIPEDNRPPTHYQLLGISPEEQDRDVIDAAVIRQSAFVRNFQSGKHAEYATKLLNEIAAAQVCLNDKAKRAQYDAELKQKQTQPSSPTLADPSIPTKTARPGPRASASPALRSSHVVQPAASPSAASPSAASFRGPSQRTTPGRAAPRAGPGSGATALDELLGANIPPARALRPAPQKAPAYQWQVPLALAVVAIIAIIGYVAVSLGRRTDTDGAVAAVPPDMPLGQAGSNGLGSNGLGSNGLGSNGPGSTQLGPNQPAKGASIGKSPSAPNSGGTGSAIAGSSTPGNNPSPIDTPAAVSPAKDDSFAEKAKTSPATANSGEATGTESTPQAQPAKTKPDKTSGGPFGTKEGASGVEWPRSYPRNFEGVDLEAGFQSKVVFAEGTSPYVAVDGVVWNLSKGEKTGRTGAKGGAAFDLEALSPDGKFFAQTGGIGDAAVVIYACDKGQLHKRLPFQKAATRVQFVGFASSGRLITAASWGLENRVQAWSLDSGKLTNEYKTPDADFDDVALGLDGKHFATKLKFENKGLAIYDLKTGKLAARPRFPEASTWGVEAMQFSPDGQELAVLDDLGLHLTVWDGNVNVVFETQSAKGQRGWERDIAYQGPPIQWLPDGSGWLLYGRYLLDRSSQRVVWKLQSGTHHRFRFLDHDHLAAVRGSFGGSNKLVSIAVPWSLINAALAGNAAQRDALPIVETLQ
jgi:WD40 repeat protein